MARPGAGAGLGRDRGVEVRVGRLVGHRDLAGGDLQIRDDVVAGVLADGDDPMGAGPGDPVVEGDPQAVAREPLAEWGAAAVVDEVDRVVERQDARAGGRPGKSVVERGVEQVDAVGLALPREPAVFPDRQAEPFADAGREASGREPIEVDGMNRAIGIQDQLDAQRGQLGEEVDRVAVPAADRRVEEEPGVEADPERAGLGVRHRGRPRRRAGDGGRGGGRPSGPSRSGPSAARRRPGGGPARRGGPGPGRSRRAMACP